MGQLSKFLFLPGADRRLLIKVFLLVWIVRVGLWLLPFPTVRQLLRGVARGRSGSKSEERSSVERLVWAVKVSTRYVPAATCLTQALVTKALLSRSGHHATVRIGVARSEAGQFQAHAWVENDGSVVIGGAESLLKTYTLLLVSDGELL